MQFCIVYLRGDKMKPFDLEAAMSGEPCITREGEKAKFLYELKSEHEDKYIFIITDKKGDEQTFNFYPNGKWDNETDAVLDLFMIPKTKNLWIAIGKKDYETSAFAYESEDELKDASCRARNGAWIVEVEVEE
jgi:hypothetical protein